MSRAPRATLFSRKIRHPPAISHWGNSGRICEYRYCGTVVVVPPPPRACPTCTPPPAQYYVRINVPILYDDSTGFTLDRPSEIVLALVPRALSIPATNDEIQTHDLQVPLLHLLANGKSFCFAGKVSPLPFADPLAKQGLDFGNT